MRVHTRHVRAAGMCMKGGRLWFARNGFSWTDFVANGIEVELVEGTGCPLGARAVAEVRKESGNG